MDPHPPIVKRKNVTLDADSVVKVSEPTKALRSLRIITPIESPLPNGLQERFEKHLQPQPPSELPTHAREDRGPKSVPHEADTPTVLVINASKHMARELTVELSTTIPGSSVLFAPTLSTALWILKRRSVDIILATSILPDGTLDKLHDFLEMMSPPPELMVLGDIDTTRNEINGHPGYRFVELRRLSLRLRKSTGEATSESVVTLGANIRNDLNNPLQEIVAMAFVAHSSVGLSPSAEQALIAIQQAAKNMSSIVNSLEEKIAKVAGNRAN